MKITIERSTNETKTLTLSNPVRIGGKLFLDGFKAQALDESTFGAALCLGIWNGCKYKGNLKRGIKTGLMTELVFCTANGIRNVLRNYRKEWNKS